MTPASHISTLILRRLASEVPLLLVIGCVLLPAALILINGDAS